ncbi:Multidrug resistance-associated protein 1-like protein [Aphelenchoides fujianensis]|nr:Multidrug resistance-associated protein 1-like protein [Aphelenchoides fujianensis]
MNFKDERLKLISDILNGIRVWKLYGWERSMEKLAERVRAKELNELKKCIPCDAFLDGSFDMGPAVATLATFYFYLVVKENALDPATAFMVLFLFTLVRVSINFLPQLFSCTVNAYISMKRLVKFLNQEERPPVDHVLSPLLDADEVVHLQDAAFSWTGNSEDFALRDLNLRVRKGELLAVLGAVGSGKSTLLHALCNELQPTSGAAAIRPLRTAYVSQQAFIQNLTLRDNVLFDAELQPALYDRTLEACALKVDLQSLPSGDLTEIGEKGINLSGGQKARVSLARAVYFQADFYVLDDPFSAVDAHVGEHLFEQVVGPNGMLNRTTRVVALNSAAHLHLFDKIVCLTDGRITHCDTYQSLAQDPTSPIAKLLSKGSAKKKRTSLKEKKQPDESSQSSTSNDDDEEEEGEKKAREVDVLIEKEDQRHGKVHYAIYWDYIQAFGPLNFAIFLFMLMGVSTGMVAASNIFLANWSSSVNRTAEPALGNLEIYASLAVGGSVVLFFSFLLLGYGGFKASKWFHKELVASVVRAKMSWFDCTPLGRILNRFSADMEFCDSNMIPMCANVFFSLQEIAYSLLSIFFAIPWLSLALVPYFVLFVIIVRFFNSSFAQFRRMSTSSLSTLCSVVGDAYNGASSIRVFGRVGQFRQLLNKRMDRYTEANFVEQVTSGWMKGILCLLTNLMIMFFLLAGIWTAHRGFLSLGLLGMIVNSSFSMSRMFSGLAQVFRSVETEIVSVERLKEFINIEREPIWAKSSTKKPLEKISSAKIEFENIWLRYREQDDPVLKGVSFVVQPGEKIGIVGRTGAGTSFLCLVVNLSGKTSLTSVLFRLIEPFDGTIRIGNGDIRDYGTNLRRLLTIIPQDPVLFCGSLRSNLDPFEEFDDQELWAALRKAHLHDYVVGLSGKLDSEVTEGGTNLRWANELNEGSNPTVFSVGQRQLVCLARALLRTASILVLDEATAAVDAETDRLIQETIRTNFSTSTILTIAHRLHTIMDYDKVLVMDAGRVREFDAIDRLLNDRSSAFRTFAEKAGLIH